MSRKRNWTSRSERARLRSAASNASDKEDNCVARRLKFLGRAAWTEPLTRRRLVIACSAR